MLVESGGDAEAISPTGACGLLQIQSRDRSIAKYAHYFVDRPTCRELMNPSLNVGWGTHYLVTLYHRNGDDWREALYRYGPIDRGYSYADLVMAHWENAR